MLVAASNPIIARLTAWLAVVMLLGQSMPAASCGCSSDVNTTSRCCSSMDGQAERSCCSSITKQVTDVATQDSSSCCQANRRHDSTSTASSCCGRKTDSSQLATGKSCCCGANCRCGMSESSTPSVPTPAPVEDTSSDRVELVEAAPGVNLMVETHASSLLREWPAGQLAPATALDRCIVLSRFTC